MSRYYQNYSVTMMTTRAFVELAVLAASAFIGIIALVLALFRRDVVANQPFRNRLFIGAIFIILAVGSLILRNTH